MTPSDKLSILCGQCRAELAVPASAAGRPVRCPQCKTVLVVPSPEPPEPEPSPPPAPAARPKAVPIKTVVVSLPPVEEPDENEPAPKRVKTRRNADTDDGEDDDGDRPSRPRRPFRFACRGCWEELVWDGRERGVDCARCKATNGERDARRGRDVRRAIRDAGDTPETARRRRNNWYVLAVLTIIALLAVVAVQLSPAAKGFGVGVFFFLFLAYVFLADRCVKIDDERGTRLFAGMMIFDVGGYILAYTFIRVGRYPQPLLALLLSILTLIGVSWRLDGRDDSGRPRDNPPAVRPPVGDPFAPPPKPALPPLPAYTPPGEVERADEIPGAVTYWRFDEGDGDTARDTKSRATGTLRGARWVPGIRGAALAFDCRTDWFEFGPGVPLRFADDAPFTVSCWVKPTSRFGPVFSFRGENRGHVSTSAIVGVWLENGKLCAWMRRDGTIFAAAEQFGTTELVPDAWHHVAVVRHRGGTVEVYQDGGLAMTQSSREATGTFNLSVGSLGRELFNRHRPGQDHEATRHLAGAVDEFAAFDRPLTPAEIARLAGR